MSKGTHYRYRYLFKGNSVFACYESSIDLQRGFFIFPGGLRKVCHFSSFDV